MPVFKRLVAAAMLAALCATAPLSAQNPPPKQQSEYIPIKDLPPEDRLPAAPLLITAYSFVLIVFFLYVVSLARRLTTVQRDVDRLGASLKQTGKP
jgi:hypothetical protein